MFSTLQSFWKDYVMGNQVPQFQKAVREGDTKKAYSLYYTKEAIRTKVEPNVSLGSDYWGNTCLHYMAYFAMKMLYQDMILEHRGKPDMKNDKRQNCLHLLCVTGEEGSVKRDMLQFTLTQGLPGMDLQHLLKEKDMEGNTVLHLAAGAGLEECVDLLVTYHADMVAINEEGLTPADLAKKNEHDRIALRLETHMVFSQEGDEEVVAMVSEPDPELLQEIAEGPVAMVDQDLRSMKDKLLIETAEMLGVNMLTAAALLRQYGWSKEDLLGEWLVNPQQVCEKAGVDTLDATSKPDFLDNHTQVTMETSGEGVVNDATDVGGETREELECEICCGSCDTRVTIPCGHCFCRDCWKQYLEARIVGGDSEFISCPQYACYKRVPLEVIESLVSREVASKFLSFDLKAFVDSNPNIRWCPYPGCSQAVHKLAPPTSDDLTATQQPEEVKAQTVHCGKEHYFCWDCLGEAHEPCTCERWKEWLEHVEVMKVKVGETTIAETDNAASSRWLVDFSKPCPKCKSPIEKTEGCNHMTCKKCRHDFCWVCLEDWKCHNSSTGGYFSCNRYDARKKAEDMLEQRKAEIITEADKLEEIGRFLHYYERYKEHIKSLSLEEPLLDQAEAKMRDILTSALELEVTTGSISGANPRSVGGVSTGLTVTFDTRTLSELSAGPVKQGVTDIGSPESGNSASPLSGRPQVDLSFIRDAVAELLKCRRVLKASYCYGYYLQGQLSPRQFEHMQGGVEQVTEMLAEAVARPHLRKPRFEIIRLTREAREKRAALVKQGRLGFPSKEFQPFSGSMEPPHLERLLRDLDSYTPPSSRYGNRDRLSSSGGMSRRRDIVRSEGRGNIGRSRFGRRDGGEEWMGMEDVMLESRRELEADRRMEADVELAKTLSLQHQPPSPSHHTSPIPDSPDSPVSPGGSNRASTLPQTDTWYDNLLGRPHLPSDSRPRNERDADVELAKALSLQFQPQPHPQPHPLSPLSPLGESAHTSTLQSDDNYYGSLITTRRRRDDIDQDNLGTLPIPPSPVSPDRSNYARTLPQTDSWYDNLLGRPRLPSNTRTPHDRDTSPIMQRPSKMAIDPRQCRSDSSSEEEDSSPDQSPSHDSRFLSNLLPRDSKILDQWGPIFGENEDLNLAIQESLMVDPPQPNSPPPQTINTIGSATEESPMDEQGSRDNPTTTPSGLARSTLHSASQSTDWYHQGDELLTSHSQRNGSRRSKSEHDRVGTHV